MSDIERTSPSQPVFQRSGDPPALHSFPTRRSSDLSPLGRPGGTDVSAAANPGATLVPPVHAFDAAERARSEEHTSELQSRGHLVCRLLLEKKKGCAAHSAVLVFAAAVMSVCARGVL